MTALLLAFSAAHPLLGHLLTFLVGAGAGTWLWGVFLDTVLPWLVLGGLNWAKSHGMTAEQEKRLEAAIKKTDAIVAQDIASQQTGTATKP